MVFKNCSKTHENVLYNFFLFHFAIRKLYIFFFLHTKFHNEILNYGSQWISGFNYLRTCILCIFLLQRAIWCHLIISNNNIFWGKMHIAWNQRFVSIKYSKHKNSSFSYTLINFDPKKYTLRPKFTCFTRLCKSNFVLSMKTWETYPQK